MRTLRGSPARPLLIACLFVACASALAFAHAILVESSPSVDATMTGPALSITLKFNVRVDAARSRLELVLPNGRTGALPVRAGNASNTLLARASDLRPGKYKLIWQVLAADGHITRGEIPFSVN